MGNSSFAKRVLDAVCTSVKLMLKSLFFMYLGVMYTQVKIIFVVLL